MPEAFHPLAPVQRRLWLLAQLDPSSPVSNRPMARLVTGRLDVGSLRRALDEIARRHQSLRTVFPSDDGEPRQSIRPPGPVPFEYAELDGAGPAEREAEASRIASAESLAPFDLERGPLFRVKLLRLDSERHVLVALMHHIVFDGWSEHIFLDELNLLYRAFARGESSPLPELPIQYVEVARQQAEKLNGEEIRRQIEYWRVQLADLPSGLPLPVVQAAGGVKAWRGESCSLTLPSHLTDALRQFSRKERVSLFMTLLAAFQVLLARYSGQDDLTVGVPVAGRTRLDTEKLLGCFINVLAFRARLTGAPTVRELLGRTRETSLGAFVNQELPFERLVEELHLKGTPNRWPLFQVMFQLRNLPRQDSPCGGDIRFEPFLFDTGVIGGVDLNLEVRETAAALDCQLQYRSGSFSRQTAEAMLGHYRNLLEAFVHRPDDDIWRLPVLSDAERHRVLVEWNDTRVEYPAGALAHVLFEQQAARTPDAFALISEAGSLTYGELNRRANQVAHRLLSLGAGPETIAAVCMERSAGMVAALLGVLKAGAAYLPLDPRHPRARLVSLVTDARAPILLTQEVHAQQLAGCAPHILALDTGWQDVSEEDGTNPSSGVSEENLVYVFHTSGSTGTPKAVMVSHRSLCNHLFWRQEALPLTGADRVLQRASYTFDDSVWEFLQPLMAGATLVQARHGMEADSAYLVDLILRHGVTTLSMVPSQLAVFLEEPAVSRCKSLRLVTSVGESLPTALVERFFELLDADLYNGYGPAEATIHATGYACQRGSAEQKVPIGRPIANTEIYILDRHLQPVPIGVQGELCIGGAGLARGYLNDPERTAQKFIPHPFSREPGARIYKTGDLARYWPDGTIEFLGREDHQVKIRGQRVELGEIESVLAGHPAVKQAAVRLWEPTPEDKALAGYVVLSRGEQPSPQDLKAFLSARLPDYMIPSDWVFLEGMPVTASGKVDRAAFPAPHRSEGSEHVAPRNKIEAQVKAVWQEVLGISGLGVTDDFFALGGHSLAAVRVVSRIEARLGVRLPAGALLEASTIAGLARLIEQSGCDPSWRSLVPMREGRDGPPLFCLHGNDGEVLFYRELAFQLRGDRPVYGLQSPLLRAVQAGGRTLEQLAGLYLEEIRAVQPHGPYCLAGFCLGAYLAFEIGRRLQDQGEEVGLLAVIDTGGGWKLVGSWSDSLRYHLAHMANLSLGGRMHYLGERARFRTARVTARLGEMVAVACRRAGRRSPDWAVRSSARAAHLRASVAYSPGVFRGNFVFFRSIEEPWRDFRSFWSRAVEGEIVCIDVPGRGITTLREPNARVLADRLGACLDEVTRRIERGRDDAR